jgi:hypothetical protein
MAVYKDLNPADVLNDLIDVDSIKQSIINIVFTEQGTIPGFPEFGCNVRHILFEQMTPFVISTLQTFIQNALVKWEPRITNVKVSVSSIPEFNRILCDISFVVKQINTQENITFKLK